MVQEAGGTPKYRAFLSNQQKNSYFALAYNDSLPLFIFFHLKVYIIENGFWEEGNLSISYIDI